LVEVGKLNEGETWVLLWGGGVDRSEGVQRRGAAFFRGTTPVEKYGGGGLFGLSSSKLVEWPADQTKLGGVNKYG